MTDTIQEWDKAAPDYQRVYRLGLNDYNTRLLRFWEESGMLFPGARVYYSFPNTAATRERGYTFSTCSIPHPVCPGRFDRLHKNTGNNREKREAMKGKRLFFRRIRQINPTGGIGQNQVFQKFLSPPGASAEEKILLCSIQIRCLSDRPDLPQSMCLFHLSDTKAIADLSC